MATVLLVGVQRTPCPSRDQGGSGKFPRVAAATRAGGALEGTVLPASVGIGTVNPLFETRVFCSAIGGYDVTADGQRFIIAFEPGQPDVASALVENWNAELRKK